MRGHYLGGRRLVIALVVWAIAFASVPTLIAEAACSDTQLVPTLGRWEINQGLGTYDRLTRGKDILVRLYLTLPPTSTCSPGGSQAITIMTATLTVSGPSGSASAITALNAAGLSSVNLTAAPALPDSTHDPLFVVPGNVIPSVSAGTAFFPATFNVTVTYRQKLSSTTTNTKTTVPPFSTQMTVDQQSKAIRILFQPIGDITSAATQFTDADRTAVVNAAQTLLRILPVPAGPAGSLSPSGRTGGIRYDINPGLLDVHAITGLFKLIGGTNKLCPTQSGFIALAPLLGTRLDDFNAAQTAARPDGAEDAADYIVGVYGELVSGSSADVCPQGMASVGSKVSIARAVSDKPKSGSTPAKVSLTGAVIAQELTHNLGGQPYPRSSTYHSSYVQADTSDPDGAYNIASALYIAADKTVMNVDSSTSPWDNSVTVFEKPDYEYVLCRFGGNMPSGAECTAQIPGGTLTGVAAIDAYVAAGNTAGGLVEGYHASSAQTAEDPSSPYRLLVLNASGLVLNNPSGTPPGTGVPVSNIYTHGPELTSATGLFSFALPSALLDGAVEIKLVNGATVIFDKAKFAAPPSVTELTHDYLVPGQVTTMTKSVTPPKNPDGDIVFLADTTGSMSGAISNVQGKAREVMNAIRAKQANSRFGVASYKDFNTAPAGCTDSTYPYRLEQAVSVGTTLEENLNGAVAAIGRWEASGGCDRLEAQLNALDQLATSTATGFRVDLPRAAAWFGDEPGHNPSGPEQPTSGISLDTAIRHLRAAGIRVVAVSVNSSSDPGSPSAGLDECPSELGTNPTGLPCDGQATRIAEATGGAVRSDASSSEVADALLAGLLSATVEPHWTCQAGLTLSVEPARRVVRSGSEEASFTETLTVGTGTPAGTTCTVDFFVNGLQLKDPAGIPDPNFRQVITSRAATVTKVTVQAQATTGNQDSVADFIYNCPGTPYFPVATAVPHTGTAIPSGDRFNLTFETSIDSSMVPGGLCTLTAFVTDMFQRSDGSDPNATTTFKVATKKPRDVTIYTPTDGTKFGTKATVVATGGGTDPEGGTITFAWSLAGPCPTAPCPPTPVIATATGPKATFPPPSPQWAIGDYTLTLTGTDSDDTASATRNFSIVADSALPPYEFTGFFSPAKNWPDVNVVNGGAAFTPKWIIRAANGQEVTTPNPPDARSPIGGAQLQLVDCTNRDPIGSPIFDWRVGATMIRYDQKGGQWVANVNIPPGAGLCYTWTLELADGSLHALFLKTK